MQSKTWSEVLKFHRHRLNLTSKKLAQKAGIDPSYITLMERGGLIPRREKVLALAQALKMDSDALLLAAGYAPDNEMNLSASSRMLQFGALIPELRQCLRRLIELPKQQQREAARMLSSYLEITSARRGGK